MCRYVVSMKFFIFLIFCAGVLMEDVCRSSPNIALNKSSKQSSTLGYVNTTYWESCLANDGNTQQHNPGPGPSSNVYGICSHTTEPPQSQEWWAVNLGAIFDIFGIIIYGRDDCCFERFQDFDVDVIAPLQLSTALTFDTFDDGYIAFNFHQLKRAVKLIIDCPGNMRGQFVRIRHRGKRILTLCEVEVYGELACLSAASVSRHVRFLNRQYQGKITGTFHAKSRIECIAFCKALPCNYAANFNNRKGQCLCTGQTDPATGDGLIFQKAWNAFLLA